MTVRAIILPLFAVGITLSLVAPGAMSLVTRDLQQPARSSSTDATLLIIAPAAFAAALQPLVDHKRSTGISTFLAPLDDIYDQMYWFGRDEAEKVKYYIKEAHEQWGTQYVLLVGGRASQLAPLWHCPVRYVASEDDWEAEFLSDLYFADLYNATGAFSSWDEDADGIFGEWYLEEHAQDGPIDLVPDIAVGRFPCRTAGEVARMVDKVIAYETGAYGQPWFKTFLLAAGDTYPECLNANWTGSEGEFYADRAAENMTAFVPIKLYTSDGTFASKGDVIAAMRSGCGFLYLVGHGSPKQWGNHPYNSTAFIQGPNTNDMVKFRNADRLPVCVVSGCHNCQFDVCLIRILDPSLRWKQEFVPECWGERVLSVRNGGAIASIGATALGYTKEDKTTFAGGINELEVAFFAAYGQNGSLRLGDVWSAAIQWYCTQYPIDWNTTAGSDGWIDAKVVSSWALLGDPSLRIGGI